MKREMYQLKLRLKSEEFGLFSELDVGVADLHPCSRRGEDKAS